MTTDKKKAPHRNEKLAKMTFKKQKSPNSFLFSFKYKEKGIIYFKLNFGISII
jgi:hypothetical protein